MQTRQTVTSGYDEEREDGYGRTLAHIKLRDDRYVSDEIAWAGLGNAVVLGDSVRRSAEVREALVAASGDKRGLFDPERKCSLAAKAAPFQQLATQAQ
jgi:micrococcal nuclease